MNLVLDTNVLIAAFIGKGLCHTLLEHCLRVHASMTSEFILSEVREKLTEKFNYSDEDAAAVLSLLQSKMQVVEFTPLAASVCRDPDDDAVLATAIAGNASCIITGDKDLLVLKRFDSVDILSPSEFTDYEESLAPQ